MKSAKSVAARLAGILIFALSSAPMALAEEDAPVQSAESVRVAQAENDGRYNDSRPVTLGDLHRFQDQQNEQMSRMEARINARIDATNDRLDTITTLLVGALLTIIAAMAGIIAVLLPRREKSREPALREPARINPNTDRAPAR